MINVIGWTGAIVQLIGIPLIIVTGEPAAIAISYLGLVIAFFAAVMEIKKLEEVIQSQ